MTRYDVVTPVRDEAENLERLAACLAGQTVPPRAWVVVDTGSGDRTPALAAALARRHPWLRLLSLDGGGAIERGGRVVAAFEAGVSALDDPADVVVKLDADLSFDPDYFERLLAAFDAEPRLGMASGTCFERGGDDEWRQRHVTGTTVWGASRAYRRECLEQILPLERRMGWDGIDEIKANLRGWTTRTIVDLPFRHHRVEGERDGAARRSRAAQGRAAWYMGYRPSYLALRALRHLRRDPAAPALLWGYALAAARREPRCADAAVVAHLRNGQRLGALPRRLGESLGFR